MKSNMEQAVEYILASELTVAFTGAGISVESGIPPFRGENGLWSTVDPGFIEIDYFHRRPKQSWEKIREIFYDNLLDTQPNPAHYALADMEQMGLLEAVITQNIDDLHRKAGNTNIYEFHGTAGRFVCEKCGRKSNTVNMDTLPPKCEQCGGLIKPDFVFFGEPIPDEARTMSFRLAEACDVMILVGTSGFVVPASFVPTLAKQNGAHIIEINLQPSNYTDSVADIFLQGKASEILSELVTLLRARMDQ